MTFELLDEEMERFLADEETKAPAPTWQVVYTIVTIILMFAVLMTDRVATDCVMLTALTVFYLSGVIDMKEALAGFSSQGLLTVIALFAVAEGLHRTGALHYYIGKLLGVPRSISGAQLRVMVPIAMLSGFINDTPLVTVALPSVIAWAHTHQISTRYLMMPLSFAALLGGVCTLTGTSTNLVIAGLLQDRYPDTPEFQDMSLFAIGQYGVPVTFIGIAYVVLMTPWLVLGRGQNANKHKDSELFSDVLLGARLTPWSPAAGRTVQRSGLRDTGGIYLVRVKRQSTGNVHHAVGPDFVLQVGDVLYFTGLIETFGEFCAEHGLEVVTNEVAEDYENNDTLQQQQPSANANASTTATSPTKTTPANTPNSTAAADQEAEPFLVVPKIKRLPNLYRDEVGHTIEVYNEDLGYSLESLLEAEPHEAMRVVYHMQDAIRGEPNAYKLNDSIDEINVDSYNSNSHSKRNSHNNDRLVITTMEPDLLVVALETADRSGLLLDISKCLARLELDLQHTEAAVLHGGRSVSVWRCKSVKFPLFRNETKDYVAEIWAVFQALLAKDSGVAAVKQRGLRVIRAIVMPHSRLVGTTAARIDFRKTYKAAIIAIQKGSSKDNNNNNNNNSTAAAGTDTNDTESLANVTLQVGDALVLQVSDDSPLLQSPPDDFYKKLVAKAKADANASKSTAGSFFGLGFVSRGSNSSQDVDDDSNMNTAEMGQGQDAQAREAQEAIWKDLQVLVANSDEANKGEFLTAMKVAPGARIKGQTLAQAGIDKIPNVFLVSLERPIDIDPDASGNNLSSYVAIPTDEKLKEGDVLWFSCKNAESVGDLRKIPGLMSYETDEVEKINAKVHDRRLVQAVVARKGGLAGKTVKDVRFRTQYGAAVIAVQREGHRVHEHPGNIKLQAGDVLLLEAGPSFLTEKIQRDRSFALVSEVKDSAPPRMRMLIPAIVLTIAAYGCYVAKLTQLIACAMVAAILMVTFGIMSQDEARDSIRWEIYLTIAPAYGIGTALVNSGVASAIAGFLVKVGNSLGIGEAGLLGAVYLGTVLISQLVANNAAAALIFPIAMDAAESTGTNLTLMSYTIMLAASAAFMTPFGYQTNLMVMGPGGYSTADYLKFGTPMQIVLLFSTTAFLVIPMWISWLGAFIVFVVVASYRVIGDLHRTKHSIKIS